MVIIYVTGFNGTSFNNPYIKNMNCEKSNFMGDVPLIDLDSDQFNEQMHKVRILATFISISKYKT